MSKVNYIGFIGAAGKATTSGDTRYIPILAVEDTLQTVNPRTRVHTG
ncbi:MAG: hypothetical protein WBV41_18235 [Terriglobales bacterium]